MQCRYTEYGTKTRIEPNEATGIFSLCLYLTCAEYEFETFGSTCDQIRLMAFYLHTDVIRVGLETIHSISDKICIITNDL